MYFEVSKLQEKTADLSISETTEPEETSTIAEESKADENTTPNVSRKDGKKSKENHTNIIKTYYWLKYFSWILTIDNFLEILSIYFTACLHTYLPREQPPRLSQLCDALTLVSTFLVSDVYNYKISTYKLLYCNHIKGGS